MRATQTAAKLWLGLWFSLVFAVLLIFPPPSQDLGQILGTPSWPRLLGSDAFGRDLLWTTLRASATSLSFAVVAAIASITVALFLGAWIETSRPWARTLAARLLEAVLTFPSLLFALAWAAVRGPGWGTLMAALLIGSVPSMTRLAQVRTRELLTEDYVLAASSLGASHLWIIRKHLFPALLSLARVKAPNLLAHAIAAEATLSFLGIGAPVAEDTWGSLLAQGKDYLLESPHIAWIVGIPLVLTLTALQNLSEWNSRRDVKYT